MNIDAMLKAMIAEHDARLKPFLKQLGIPDAPPKVPKSQRPACGAKTRKGGTCQAKVVEGKTRCRMHGGLSTGPKTEAGRQAIGERGFLPIAPERYSSAIFAVKTERSADL